MKIRGFPKAVITSSYISGTCEPSITSRIVEWSFRGFPTISATRVIKRKALVSCPGHHFRILHNVLHHCDRLDSVDPAAVGVREKDGARDWVCGQVIFVCRAVAAISWRNTSGLGSGDTMIPLNVDLIIFYITKKYQKYLPLGFYGFFFF